MAFDILTILQEKFTRKNPINSTSLLALLKPIMNQARSSRSANIGRVESKGSSPHIMPMEKLKSKVNIWLIKSTKNGKNMMKTGL